MYSDYDDVTTAVIKKLQWWDNSYCSDVVWEGYNNITYYHKTAVVEVILWSVSFNCKSIEFKYLSKKNK